MEAFSFKFYLNKDKKKGNKFKIYGRVIINKKKAEFYTLFAVEETNWDENRQRPIK